MNLHPPHEYNVRYNVPKRNIHVALIVEKKQQDSSVRRDTLFSPLMANWRLHNQLASLLTYFPITIPGRYTYYTTAVWVTSNHDSRRKRSPMTTASDSPLIIHDWHSPAPRYSPHRSTSINTTTQNDCPSLHTIVSDQETAKNESVLVPSPTGN